MSAFMDDFGATHCAVHAEEGNTPLSDEMVKTLEVDLGSSLLQDGAFQAWGMGSVESQLIGLAAGVYCESCGRRLQGDRRVREGRA